VAASRLDVPGFDTAELLDRLRYFADVVERCGGPAEREAFTRIGEATGWRERAGNGAGTTRSWIGNAIDASAPAARSRRNEPF